MTSNPWEIGRPADQCAATGRAIEPGDEFMAALVEREDGAFERIDFAMDAWPDVERPPQLFAFWRAVRAAPNAKNQPLLDASTIGDLFDQLAEATEPRRVAFRYVLALVLVRKRKLELLKQRAASGEDPPLLLVRFRGTDKELPPIEVIDPEMDDETIIAISEQIQQIMALDD